MFFIRVAIALTALILAYCFWRYINNCHDHQGRADRLLVVAYASSRLGLWLLFALFMQRYVTSSDPKLFYTPMLKNFLAGDTPIREFFYPYGPLLIPSMLPFYVLLGQSLAGISLFAIFAEAVTLGFFLKSMRLLKQRGEIEHRWAQETMAIYLLNPATLYWTVFQGYHSIAQTAYSMAALYFLLRRHHVLGYSVGFYGLAGTKFLAILDWPALLAACRPKAVKLLWGTAPLLITYAIFQLMTGDILFPLRFHLGYMSEGNVWYLLTLFDDLRGFYSMGLGRLLPLLLFCILFLLGFVHWIVVLRRGRAAFSFPAAMGMATFTISLFFLCSLYTGNYYVPMLMLPASLVVTCPSRRSRNMVGAFLLISALCVFGDAMWTAFGQPLVLHEAFASVSLTQRVLAGFWTSSILVRVICFAILAYAGLRLATSSRSPRHTLLVAAEPSKA